MRILLAEDEKSLVKALVKLFEKNNCSVDAVYNGEDFLSYLTAGNYDVCVLDIMMPYMDGITALRIMRSKGIDVPVLLLSSKGEIEDKVLGLDSGANDYLTKPFDPKELMARLRVLTRSSVSADSLLRMGNITLNRATYELSTSHGSLRLANKEFQMLEMLMKNPRHLISTEKFMERIWGLDSDSEINVVWVYISYLRKKLTALYADVEIRASRNAGYSLEEVDDKKS